MKPLNKHYSYLFSLVLPILTMTAVIGILWQKQIIASLMSTQWVYALGCFLLCCLATSHPIHQSKPRQSWLCALGYTVLFQSALGLHLIALFRLTLITLPVAIPTQASTTWHMVAPMLDHPWLLFPWSLYAVFGLSIAVFCYPKEKQSFLSDATEAILKNKKNDAISLLVNFTGRTYILGFVVLSSVFCLNLTRYIAQHTHTTLLFSYNTAALLLSTFLMLPISLQKPRTVLARMFQHKIPAAITLCFFLILLSGYTVTLCALYPYVKQAATQQVATLTPLWLPGTWQQRWWMFMMLYVISWAPLAAGLIAHLAQGYTLRQMICMQLVFPAVITLAWQQPLTHTWLTMPWPAAIELALSCVSLCIILGLFYRKQGVTAMIRTQTYQRTDKMRSAHVLTRSILFSSTALISIYAISGIQVLSFMLLLLVIYCFYSALLASTGLFTASDYVKRPWQWFHARLTSQEKIG